MSIHKTQEGTWQVRYRDSKHKHRAKTFKKKVDAEKFEAQVTLDLHVKQNPLAAPVEAAMTFAEYSKLWVKDHAEVHKTEASVIRDEQMLRLYILPYLGDNQLGDISKRDGMLFQGWLRRHQTPLKNKTINTIVGTVHKMLSDAVEWEYISANKWHRIRGLKCPEVDYRFWSEAERDRFLTFARSRNELLHDIVTIGVYTGMRRGEIQGLLRDSINFDTGYITVKRNYCFKTHKLNEHTKGKRNRQIPMNEAVRGVLAKHQLLAPNQPIINVSLDHYAQRFLKPLQRKAGLSNIIGLHDLRHSFASHLAMRGVSLFKIQKLLGHADIGMVQRYAHLIPDELNGITEMLLPGTPKNHPQTGTPPQADVRDLFVKTG